MLTPAKRDLSAARPALMTQRCDFSPTKEYDPMELNKMTLDRAELWDASLARKESIRALRSSTSKPKVEELFRQAMEAIEKAAFTGKAYVSIFPEDEEETDTAMVRLLLNEKGFSTGCIKGTLFIGWCR